MMNKLMGCATQKSNTPTTLAWTGKSPVLVIAHRGYSGLAPENTVVAFRKAIEAGADMIELDVHLSRDGHVVVIHDDTLDRTAGVRGKVAAYSLDQLKQLDAGSWFNPQFAGERIPSLKEVLDLACGRIPVHIELKKGDTGQFSMMDLADRTVQEVEEARMLNQVLFGSFDTASIDRVRHKNRSAYVAVIYSQSWSLPQEVTGGRPIPVLSCSGKVLNQANLSRAHQQGMRVLVWTLNAEEHMNHFLNLGVDGIITDHPDRLIEVLRKKYT